MAQAYAPYDAPEIVIPTQGECWVVPRNCQLVKLLFEQQELTVSDLRFRCDQHKQCFVRQLFLLALQDEYETRKPSPLAKFARATMLATPSNNHVKQAHYD